MLKIGVLGAGHLGRIHIKLLKGLTQQYELVGCYDPDKSKAEAMVEKYQIKAFDSMEDLVEAVDVVNIVTPTVNHFECAALALRHEKHIFIEKPVTSTLNEAQNLMHLAAQKNVKIQIGHVERFNAAFAMASNYIDHPMFIESHRLAPFNPRGTDVSVVLDLMIHDIDIILSLIKSKVKNVHASGVTVVSKNPDIANARIEFENGCVANLTASRISLKTLRKSRFFQESGYISVDFGQSNLEVFKLTKKSKSNALSIELDNNEKHFDFINPDIEQNNAIEHELKSFAKSINENTQEKVSLKDGVSALEVAYQILDKINA